MQSSIIISDIDTIRGVLAEVTINIENKKVSIIIEKDYINRIFKAIGKIGLKNFVEDYLKILKNN